MKRVIQPEKLSKPRGDYSHGISVTPREILFIAGQTAVDSKGNVVGIGDAGAQAKQIYENIEAVLAAAGMAFSNVVKLTTYVTDVSFRESVNEVRKRHLGKELPASTLVVVKGLARSEYLLEIEAIAVRED